MNKLNSYLYCLISILILQSCKTYQNVPYFKDIPDSAKLAIKTASYKELKIEKGDVLNINVMTIDPTANSIFSQSSGSSGLSQLSAGTPSNIPAIVSGQQTSSTGYPVDNQGMVELPLLGKFKAEGLSTDSLKNIILGKATEYYKTPAITVRFSNLKVNVLGEVSRPGSYNLLNEKNTIFDALSLAGDLTIFGRRENVLLIRDSAGVSQMTRFSLNSKDIVQQNFFISSRTM